jgi:surfactin synthase thioesterase subunit
VGSAKETVIGEPGAAIEVAEHLQSKGPDLAVVYRAVLHVVFVHLDVADDTDAVRLAGLVGEAFCVPVADLDTEKDAEHDNDEVDAHSEPVVRSDVLANAAQQHDQPPVISLPLSAMLVDSRRATSAQRA